MSIIKFKHIEDFGTIIMFRFSILENGVYFRFL
jgi:hypothetical protein